MSVALDVMSLRAGDAAVEIDGRTLTLTNLDKTMWPRTRTSKRRLIDYYVRIADILLPHIYDRPLTLWRFPDGVDGTNWWQTTCPHPPEWMRTHPVPKRDGEGSARDHCVVTDIAGLVWVANLASIELHPLLSTAARPDEATAMVFDLDPGPGTSIVDCCVVALALRAALGSSGLESVVKTSGSAGIHVFAPLNSGATFDATKRCARGIARSIAADLQELATDRAQRRERIGKVFIDWGQNDASRSTIAPYSLRAMPWPAASTPLRWEEVEAIANGDVTAVPLDADAIFERVDAHGDLFRPALALRQDVRAAE